MGSAHCKVPFRSDAHTVRMNVQISAALPRPIDRERSHHLVALPPHPWTDSVQRTTLAEAPLDLKAISKHAPSNAVRDPELARYLSAVKRDFNRCREYLPAMGAPTLVMGSARKLSNRDRGNCYALGASLAAVHCPPVTGAGPAVMSWVPEGFGKGVERLRSVHRWTAGESDDDTFGVGLQLPHEMQINPHISKSVELDEFLLRKWLLYVMARGAIVMPGGYGTKDELFELWTQAARGEHAALLAAVGSDFWSPMLDVLAQKGMNERNLIDRSAWDRLEMSDAVGALARELPEVGDLEAAQKTALERSQRMEHDFGNGIRALDRNGKDVVYLGGRGLEADDPTLRVMQEASRLLTRAGLTARVGNPSAVAAAVVEGVRQATPSSPDPRTQSPAPPDVRALTMRNEDFHRTPGLRVIAEQSDYIIHKDLLTRHARGIIAAPGGLGTMASLFGVLTEIQCEKRERIPVICIGTDFYQPYFDALKQAMLSDTRQTISETDLDLVKVTDDPWEVAAATMDMSVDDLRALIAEREATGGSAVDPSRVRRLPLVAPLACA